MKLALTCCEVFDGCSGTVMDGEKEVCSAKFSKREDNRRI